MRRKKTKRTGTLRKKIALLRATYPLGMILALLSYIGMFFDLLVVLHPERLECLRKKGPKIILVNHPSLADAFFIAILLLRYFIFRPLQFAPLIVADVFFKRWPFSLLDRIIVPIDRSDEFTKTGAFLRMREAVDSGQPVIIHGEGGRTISGTEEDFVKSPNYGKTGNKIRYLQGGIASLARVTGAEIITVGIVGSDNAFPNFEKGMKTQFVPLVRVAMAVGKPRKFGKHDDKMKIVHVLGQSLLSLMDEASAATA